MIAKISQNMARTEKNDANNGKQPTVSTNLEEDIDVQ